MRQLVLGGVLAVTVACGGGGGDDPEDSAFDRGPVSPDVTTTLPATTTTPPPPPPEPAPVGAVGEAVTAGGWTLLVHEVTDPYGPATLPDGRRAVTVDLEITRDEGDPARLSSFENFQLTQADGTWPGVDVESLPSIGGPIAPGETHRATIGFFVPASTPAPLVLQFRPSLVAEPVVAVQIS